MREQVRKLALEFGVVILMNVQFAVKDNEITFIEVNLVPPGPCPLVSKATGAPLAKIAARVMAGQEPEGAGLYPEIIPPLLLGERGGSPVRQVPGCGSAAGAGNALHR